MLTIVLSLKHLCSIMFKHVFESQPDVALGFNLIWNEKVSEYWICWNLEWVSVRTHSKNFNSNWLQSLRYFWNLEWKRQNGQTLSAVEV